MSSRRCYKRCLIIKHHSVISPSYPSLSFFLQLASLSSLSLNLYLLISFLFFSFSFVFLLFSFPFFHSLYFSIPLSLSFIRSLSLSLSLWGSFSKREECVGNLPLTLSTLSFLRHFDTPFSFASPFQRGVLSFCLSQMTW